ncbi:MAG: FAD binding domain-containing protein [Fidelibacterota bacterium]
MWRSIQSIKYPQTLQEAFMLQSDDTILFSGGSYLVAEQSSAVKTLIDINHLLDNSIHVEMDFIRIGAKATLQEFIDKITPLNPESKLLKGIRSSCPSKNIRNQRTFGGELGQNRANSEVMVFLHAIGANISITTKEDLKIPLRDWDGKGIVTEIIYFPGQVDDVELLRYSVIPSAPAIVIVCVVRRNNRLEIAIGGLCNKTQNFSLNVNNWNPQSVAHIAQNAIKYFQDDYLGSMEYKTSLITTALLRGGNVG